MYGILALMVGSVCLIHSLIQARLVKEQYRQSEEREREGGREGGRERGIEINDIFYYLFIFLFCSIYQNIHNGSLEICSSTSKFTTMAGVHVVLMRHICSPLAQTFLSLCLLHLLLLSCSLQVFLIVITFVLFLILLTVSE